MCGELLTEWDLDSFDSISKVAEKIEVEAAVHLGSPRDVRSERHDRLPVEVGPGVPFRTRSLWCSAVYEVL